MVTLPMYHICLICTAIGYPVRGGLPHQGVVLASITHVWYYVHMLAMKSHLRGVYTKFAMLISHITVLLTLMCGSFTQMRSILNLCLKQLNFSGDKLT